MRLTALFSLMLVPWTLCAGTAAEAADMWVEDFKTSSLGFDHPWEEPVVISGTGWAEWTSDGEIGRLALHSEDAYRCWVTTSRSFPWDESTNRFCQIRFSRLTPRARLKLYAISDADGGVPHVILNHYDEAEHPPANELLTVDLRDKLPAGTRSLRVRVELTKDGSSPPSPTRENPPKGDFRPMPRDIEVYLDWIKLGAPGGEGDPPGAPVAADETPAAFREGEPVTLRWAPPADSPADGYTLICSRDPLFAAACLTELDAVPGTRHTLAAPLAPGTWYWTVSATRAGLSGPFLLDQATGQPPSIVIQRTLSPDERAYDHFSIRGGACSFGSLRHFSDEPILIEQARRMLEMGADAYKFLIGGENYVKCYTDLSDEIREKSRTMVELVQNEPAYKTLLDMPFKYFVMWAYAMKVKLVFGQDQFTEEVAAAEYDQIYEFARWLLQTYAGTGKVFLIGHWEGDNMLMGGATSDVPSEAKIADLIRWHRNRQQAVTDARNSLPDVQGVEVYHYSEVNAISPVLDKDLPRMINAILPHVPVDLISYSAYNCLNHTDELPERAYTHLDYILEHGRFTGAWKHSKPVFIGEYGLPLPPVPQRPHRNRLGLKAVASWGSPINLFWSTYTQLENDNSALFSLEGEKTEDYYVLADYVAKMHFLRNATRVWLERNPTDQEASRLALDYDRIAPHDILRRILDSLEYRFTVTDEEFIESIFASCGMTGSGALTEDLVTSLREGRLTRFEALCRILDSDEFAGAMGEEEFDAWLAMHLLSDTVEFPDGAPTRSERYLSALDHEAFRDRNIAAARLNHVTPELRRMYQPEFRASGEAEDAS